MVLSSVWPMIHIYFKSKEEKKHTFFPIKDTTCRLYKSHSHISHWPNVAAREAGKVDFWGVAVCQQLYYAKYLSLR